MRNTLKRISAATTIVLAQTMTMFAQNFNFDTMMQSTTDELGSALKKFIDLASIFIAVVGVIMLVWNYVKSSKGEGQGSDGLAKWGVSLLFAVLCLQIIKRVFIA